MRTLSTFFKLKSRSFNLTAKKKRRNFIKLMKFVSEFCAKSDNTDTHLSSLITFIVRENLKVPSANPNTQLYT